MDRSLVERHLAQAQRHVADGERHVEEQRALVSELERHGHDTAQAVRLLGQFEEMLALHRSDRDRLLKELEE